MDQQPLQQQPLQPEQPLYLLTQKKTRALIPKIISLIFLGAIFYLGILLNIVLLELTAKVETNVKLISLVLVILIIIIGIFFAIKQSSYKSLFYHQKIFFNKKEIDYINITNTLPKQNLLDKIFRTYQIQLSKEFYLRHISQETQIQNYLQQLVNYAQQTAGKK